MLPLPIQAYDSHCNLVLGDVEETIYVVDDDDEDEVKVCAFVFHVTTCSPSPSLLLTRSVRADCE